MQGRGKEGNRVAGLAKVLCTAAVAVAMSFMDQVADLRGVLQAAVKRPRARLTHSLTGEWGGQTSHRLPLGV